MYMKKYNTVLAGLMCIALGACGTTERSAMNPPTTGEGYSETAGASTDSSGSSSDTSGSMGASGSSTGSSAGTSGGGAMGQSATMSSYGVVQAVEMIPRSQAAGSGAYSGSNQSGGSGTATGASGDMVYRLTLRLDDGTVRSVTQESQPSIQAGDRVRLANGIMQRD